MLYVGIGMFCKYFCELFGFYVFCFSRKSLCYGFEYFLWLLRGVWGIVDWVVNLVDWFRNNFRRGKNLFVLFFCIVRYFFWLKSVIVFFLGWGFVS